MSRGAVREKKLTRVIEGIPGTVTHGFKEQPIIEQRLGKDLIEVLARRGIDVVKIGLKRYTMGPCNILVGKEPAAVGGDLLWHLTISTPSRHPTWDEIKVARYRLLPDDICTAILLPPSQYYVNVESQDHVFQVWEIQDPRMPWTTG